MRKSLLALVAVAFTALTLSACAGTYVGGDIGPRRVTEPVGAPYR